MPNGQRMNDPGNDSINFVMDSGATEHLVDNELNKIPGLGDVLYEYNIVDEPNKIFMAGGHTLVGTEARILLPGLSHARHFWLWALLWLCI